MKSRIMLASCFLLTGCVGTMENPYANLSSHQLSALSPESLCANVNNRYYRPSLNVVAELQKRGYRDCSGEEVYCRRLDLRPGTAEYANCRLTYQQNAINYQRMANESLYQHQSLQNQQQLIQQQNSFGAGRMNCTSYRWGNSVNTSCY